MNRQWRFSPNGEAGCDGISPGLMVNGEGDCVATNLRPGRVQCRGLGRTLARSRPARWPQLLARCREQRAL